MNDHEHIPLDAALEALARPEVPVDHVERVLARTGPREASVGRAGAPSRPSPSLRPRWALAVAATLLAVLGGAWLGERAIQTRLDVVIRMETDTSENGADALPLTARSENGPYPLPLTARSTSAAATADTSENGADALPLTARSENGPYPLRLTARSTSAAATVDTSENGADALPLTARSENGPYPLRRLEIAPILPAPLVVAPLAPLEDITLVEIPLEPIVIAPIDQQETP